MLVFSVGIDLEFAKSELIHAHEGIKAPEWTYVRHKWMFSSDIQDVERCAKEHVENYENDHEGSDAYDCLLDQ